MENTQNPIFIEDTADNGVIENVHIAPIGNFTGSDREGNPVEQTIDAESLTALADKLNAGDEVLADVDHGSAKAGVEKDTQAAGWFSRFVVDPIKGLFGMLRLTKSGKELVENREYRYISPAFQLDENGKPVDMIAASLTNMPAFKGAINPIINTQPEEKDFMEKMTKDDLVALIKETVIALNTCSDEKKEVENACSETKEETVVENTETTEEAKEEAKEEAAEAKAEAAEEKAEAKAEAEEKLEEKEEVVKLEALNSMPNVKPVDGTPEWANLHGKAFFDWLKNHK